MRPARRAKSVERRFPARDGNAPRRPCLLADPLLLEFLVDALSWTALMPLFTRSRTSVLPFFMAHAVELVAGLDDGGDLQGVLVLFRSAGRTGRHGVVTDHAVDAAVEQVLEGQATSS